MNRQIKKRNLILVILGLFLLNANILSAKQNVTFYGCVDYSPYSYEENGEPKGIYVDIIKQVFSEIPEYNLIIKIIPWKTCLEYFKAGKCVAIFPPYSTEERKAWMTFSEPIFRELVVVFGKPKNLKGKLKWPEDFYGSSIAVNESFDCAAMGGKKFGDACKDGRIIIKEEISNDQNLKNVELEKVDFYINDRFIDISKYPSIKKGMKVRANYGHISFTKKKGKYPFIPDLVIKFNKRIQYMKKNKEIEKIVTRYRKRK